MRVQLASLALLLLVAPPEALGVETPAPPAPPEVAGEAPAPSLAEVVGGAGEVEARVRQIEVDLAPNADLEAMAANVRERLKGLEERAAAAREQIEAATQLRSLTSTETRWLPEQEALEAWRRSTTDRARAINEGLASTDELIRVWEETRKEAPTPSACSSCSSGVARAHDRILEVPAPSALFLEFGDSALGFRLRAWTAHFDQWVAIRSDLTVGINAALKEARIEIPFPQRDLHLRSVADEARDALAGPEPPTTR